MKQIRGVRKSKNMSSPGLLSGCSPSVTNAFFFPSVILYKTKLYILTWPEIKSRYWKISVS